MEATISRGIRLKTEAIKLIEERAASVGASFNEYIRELIDSFAALTENEYHAKRERRDELRKETLELLKEIEVLEFERDRLNEDKWQLIGSEVKT